MNHDELLARINELSIIDELDLTEEYLAVKALLAVTELHKPYDWHPGCAQCGYYEYPCPTIKAIEAELK